MQTALGNEQNCMHGSAYSFCCTGAASQKKRMPKSWFSSAIRSANMVFSLLSDRKKPVRFSPDSFVFLIYVPIIAFNFRKSIAV